MRWGLNQVGVGGIPHVIHSYLRMDVPGWYLVIDAMCNGTAIILNHFLSTETCPSVNNNNKYYYNIPRCVSLTEAGPYNNQ